MGSVNVQDINNFQDTSLDLSRLSQWSFQWSHQWTHQQSCQWSFQRSHLCMKGFTRSCQWSFYEIQKIHEIFTRLFTRFFTRSCQWSFHEIQKIHEIFHKILSMILSMIFSRDSKDSRDFFHEIFSRFNNLPTDRQSCPNARDAIASKKHEW